ncbi:MAG: hydantoinase B/oxoprolinase family protein [Terracidiphilus sp.]
MEKLAAWGEDLLDYSERLVRAELKKMPAGICDADDWLDDDGVTDEPRRIAVRLTIDPEAGAMEVDFAGSSAQVAGRGERGSRDYAFGMLLCVAVFARGRCAGDGGDFAATYFAHA